MSYIILLKDDAAPINLHGSIEVTGIPAAFASEEQKYAWLRVTNNSNKMFGYAQPEKSTKKLVTRNQTERARVSLFLVTRNQ